MVELVTCSDCGHQYDSQTDTFCMKCGNLSRMSNQDQATAHRLAVTARQTRGRGHQGAVIVACMSAIVVLLMSLSLISLSGGGLDAVEQELSATSRSFDVEVRAADGHHATNHTVEIWASEQLLWNGTTNELGLVTVPTLDQGQFWLLVPNGDGAEPLQAELRAWDVQLPTRETVAVQLGPEGQITVPANMEAMNLGTAVYVLMAVVAACGVAGLIGSVSHFRRKAGSVVLLGSALGSIPWIIFGGGGALLGGAGFVALLLPIAYFAGLSSMWRANRTRQAAA